MIKVFHMTKEAREENPISWITAPEKVNCSDFGTVIAIIDSDDLEEAYMLTNHIDDDWTKNEKVTMRTERPQRSSSVGDLFELHPDKYSNINLEEGSYLVDGAGFKKACFR